jgi:outer membrane protein OmpA-like peptidoglycan-associated protein
LSGESLIAQVSEGKYRSTNKAAIRLFEDGKKQYDSRQDDKAIRLFQAAIDKDSLFSEALLILGQIYLEQEQTALARTYYRKAVTVDPAYLPGAHALMGDIEVQFANYAQAAQDFRNYLKYVQSPSADRVAEINRRIAGCEFALDAMKHPVPFKPVNLGQGVNTPEAEYFPSFTVDQRQMVFTRDVPDGAAAGGHQEDFFISSLNDTVWSAARNAGAPLNSGMNEGAPSISADGRVLFFTACERPDGRGSCDIYLSRRMDDGSWSKPVNIGSPINTSAWESQPSFSSDGKTLYFIRGSYNRERRRMTDIYVSTFREDMTWSEPKKLPAPVNTPGQEESVFIHPDNRTLYFSSDGHVGMGGKDIYVSRLNSDSSWSEPVNMGYPVNTQADENSVVVSADGRKAYFASDRSGGRGNLDIYAFDLPSSVRPVLVSYVKARVRDAANGEPLQAGFEIVDVSTGEVVVSNTTDRRKGEFLACLPAGRSYLLNVNKQGYLFYSDHFDCAQATSKQQAFELDIRLSKPVSGERVVLKNLFFDVNKYELKPESFPELERLLGFLKANAGVRITIAGHTDSSGDEKANKLLSEKRADAVKQFLLGRGVDVTRLESIGYGATKPVADNTTDEGRAKNRRTEFVIR